MLKDYLLNLGCFINNKYLDEYLNLIEQPFILSKHSEQHHIIPVSYYKLKYKVSSYIARHKLADLDINNKIVQLSYTNHLLAHLFLCYCTSGKLKSACYLALISMLGNQNLNLQDKEAILQKLNSLPELDNIGAWTIQELNFLLSNYTILSMSEIAKALNKTYPAVQNKCKRLGIKCVRTYKHSTNTKLLIGIKRASAGSIARKSVLTNEQYTWLYNNYSKLGLKKCSEYLGITYKKLYYLAYRFGLTSRQRTWTKQQEQWLLANYNGKNSLACAEYLKKSKASIINKYCALKKELVD